MKDIEHLAASINSQKEVINEAVAATKRAISKMDEAMNILNNRLKGSQRTEITSTKSHITSALTKLQMSHSCGNKTVDYLNEYLAAIGFSTYIPEDETIRMIGPQSSTINGTIESAEETTKRIGVTSGEVEKRSSDREEVVFDPETINPAGFQGINPFHKVKTAEANLFFNEGTRWNNEPLRAHYNNLKVNGEGVIKEYSQYRSVWHVEGAIARFMRNNKIREVCVYLNVQACSAVDGCSGNLQHLMPKNSIAYLQYLSPTKNEKGETTGYKARIRKVIGTGKYLETLYRYRIRQRHNQSDKKPD